MRHSIGPKQTSLKKYGGASRSAEWWGVKGGVDPSSPNFSPITYLVEGGKSTFHHSHMIDLFQHHKFWNIGSQVIKSEKQ